MQFIDEQNRARLGPLSRHGEDAPQFRHIAHHRIYAHKPTFGLGGDRLRQAGFAATGWAIENQTAETVLLNQTG